MWQGFRQVLPYLPENARRFLAFFSTLSALLALLDIAAFTILALTLTPMVEGKAIHFPLVGTISAGGYAWVLGLVCVLLISKGLLNISLQWVATRRFAAYELQMGDRLFSAYMAAPWTERVGRNCAELVRLVDLGVGNTISGVILPGSTLPAELATVGAIILVLVFSQPTTALITLLYLGAVAVIMYLGINRPAVVAGRVNRDFSFRVVTVMTEMLAALKEITLRGKLAEVAGVVSYNRSRATTARANANFLGRLPQFIVEMALVGGFALVGLVAWLLEGPAQAFSAVALFGVAGFRLVPSLVRFQSVITSAAAPLSHLDFVLQDFADARRYVRQQQSEGKEKLRAQPEKITLQEVSFIYPRSTSEAVRGVNLTIPVGSSLGLVGGSGAGKSTLVDILLGLLHPSSGQILVDDQPLDQVIIDWRSKVGYVPQDVQLFDGTIAQNVALTWEHDYDEGMVEQALRRAQLWDVVQQRPDGIHERIGERGLSLSGGQRQRLGIARALYTEPLVLVMDEATSALDTTTEQAVSSAINSLYGHVTVISVAHRLSTVRHNDQICFMKDGGIVSRGSFDEVVVASPEFAQQARLAGLVD